MAGRNYKEGLDYFKLSVDYGTDDAIELIDGEFGAKGYRIITKLMQRIYKNKGYYIDWNEKRKILFANSVNETGGLVDEIITRSFKWGLFDESVFKKFGILTSGDIQSTYLEATKRREKVEIVKEFLLCNNCVFENAICVSINANSSIVNGQSTVQYSKVNESKEINTGAASPPRATAKIKRFEAPELTTVQQFFIKNIGNPKHANSWPYDKCMNEAGQFVDHYTANGWVQGRGKPIKDWQAACRNWIRHGLKGVFEAPKPKEKNHSEHSAAPKIQKPKLEKIQVEINYLYERYLEGQLTILSLESFYYDYLKQCGAVTFNEDQKVKIKKKALEHNSEAAKDEKILIRFMKLFGVIEFFEQMKLQARETVFHVEAA